MSTKKELMKEIEEKVARKKEAAARALNNNCIEAFVVAFIDNVYEINKITTSSVSWTALYHDAKNTLRSQLQSFDKGCDIDIRWTTIKEDEVPQINGVLIKWSKNYQIEHQVDPELFVDATCILLD